MKGCQLWKSDESDMNMRDELYLSIYPKNSFSSEYQNDSFFYLCDKTLTGAHQLLPTSPHNLHK